MKKRAGALILTIIYLFCASPIVAATGGKKVIRVGFPEQHGFTMTADDGTHSGYTYDYLQEIAQYTGWEFAIVPIEGATENEALTRSLKMLESGELDLLGCISKNSYTEKTFELTNFSYGSVYSTVYVRENDTRYNKNDYQTLNGMSIALVKSKEEQFQSFCKANNITAKTVIVEGSEQLFAAVASGETDACLALDVSNTKGLRPVARYPGQPFYFAATKGKSDIITALNQAILNISQSEMDFSLNLYNKYFNPPRPAVLTDSERQFIGNIGTLRLATVEEGAPVQYFDKNGRAQGISQQIIQLVSNRTGLKVEFVRAQTYEQAYALVDEKKADGVLGVPYDYNVARKNGLVLTKPFLTSPMSLVVGPNTDISKLPELTCALLDGTPGGAQVAAEKLRYYENADALMKAVLRGEADYGYACNYAVEYSARKPAYKKLMLLSSGARTREYCVGLSRSTDLRCVSILNKIFGSISSTELQKIIFSSTAETDENISLGEYVDSNPREFAVMVAMFASLLLLIAIFIIITRSRQARRLDIEHRRYLKLSELANEYIFEYDVTHDTMSFTAEFAELIGIPPIIERYKQFFQNKSGLSEEDIDRVRALFSDMENDKSSGEFLLPTKNGEPRWFRIFCTVVRDKQGMVVAFIGKLNDIQDEKEENIRLVSRAKLDGLTGILDAAACREAISALAGVPERWPGALMIFDVDYFKNINDDLGHYSGDLVLIGIADILKSQFGKPDIIGRLGGDEFVVFIGNITSRAEAQTRAEELSNSIRLEKLRSDGKAVTVSLGCVYAARAAEFDVIYKKADAALYDVKKSGRNAVKVV